jgi:hypothetical protein
MANLSNIITPTNVLTAANTETLTNKTIDIANNTLTGVQPTLVSGTNIKTINGGSVLGSGDLALSSGAMLLVASVTASAASTVQFTNLSTTPAYYVIEFDGVFASTSATILCRLSDNNGSSYFTTGYADVQVSASNYGDSVFVTQSSSRADIRIQGNDLGTSASYPTAGIVKLLGSSNIYPSVLFDVSTINNSAFFERVVGTGGRSSTNPINAIQFRPSAGTISGNFRLYSVSKT